MADIIKVENISVSYDVSIGKKIKSIKAIDDVSLTIKKGDMVGIIGESGSGKSTLAHAILNLIQSPGKISGGKIIYNNSVSLLDLNEEEFRKIRWDEIATVFQSAQSALNPILKIKNHFYETLEDHDVEIKTEEISRKIREVLSKVRLGEDVLEKYPFELSGGQKQRILISLSLILDPQVIILDEPTTALDVINQWYILEILHFINKEMGVTLIFLSHDISIIGSIVDKLVVMYSGKIVESGSADKIIKSPSHPYTIDLMNSIPSLEADFSTRKKIVEQTKDTNVRACKYYSRCQLKNKVNCIGSDADIKIHEVDEVYVMCKHTKETDGKYN